jgi:hypothetical protein
MKFNEHSDLTGRHAFLSASNYHWINYDSDRLAEVYHNAQAARRGSELHAFAHHAISLGIRLLDVGRTLNVYVNDAIGFKMKTEQILFYSPNCYGTADAIAFNGKLLRIHDLKTGVIKGSFHQLEVYAALFCLEYGEKPGLIDIELRIYQDDEVKILVPELDVIAHIMSKIIRFDQQIEDFEAEGRNG